MELAGFDATPADEIPAETVPKPETPRAERGKIPPEHQPTAEQKAELGRAAPLAQRGRPGHRLGGPLQRDRRRAVGDDHGDDGGRC